MAIIIDKTIKGGKIGSFYVYLDTSYLSELMKFYPLSAVATKGSPYSA